MNKTTHMQTHWKRICKFQKLKKYERDKQTCICLSMHQQMLHSKTANIKSCEKYVVLKSAAYFAMSSSPDDLRRSGVVASALNFRTSWSQLNTWLHSLAISNTPFQLKLQITVQINQRTCIKTGRRTGGRKKTQQTTFKPFLFISQHFEFVLNSSMWGKKDSELEKTLLDLVVVHPLPTPLPLECNLNLWFFILFLCLTLKSRPFRSQFRCEKLTWWTRTSVAAPSISNSIWLLNSLDKIKNYRFSFNALFSFLIFLPFKSCLLLFCLHQRKNSVDSSAARNCQSLY